ncbi:MAG: ECF-type sigma factor [Planctomycetota bacterium]
MVDVPPSDAVRHVSQLLDAARSGAVHASDELLPLVYADLRRLAAARMARLAPGQTLQATALVHEAYVRLVGTADPGWQSRAHFFGAAARAMRNVLADHLQRRGSLKRGGRFQRAADCTAELGVDGPSDEVLAVEEALQDLERDYPRQAQVVTLTFFGGMTAPEVAEALGMSTRTVERDWRFARSWLNAWFAEPEDPS